jgi:hypothetical protein
LSNIVAGDHSYVRKHAIVKLHDSLQLR